MPGKINDDELYELHHDRALSEMDVGITDYGDNEVYSEDSLFRKKETNHNKK